MKIRSLTWRFLLLSIAMFYSNQNIIAQQLPGGGGLPVNESGVYLSDNVNDKAETTFQIPSGSFTIEMLYSMCDLDFDTPETLIDAQGSTAGDGLDIQPSSGTWRIRTNAAGGSNETEIIPVTHTLGWHYLAFVYNAEDSINRFYIDGFEIDTFQAPISPGNFMVFGGSDLSFGSSFNGFMDDIVISDTNLYDSSILIASEYPNITEHTVAKWSFEDGQDATVFVDSISEQILNGLAGGHAVAWPEGIAEDTIQRPLNASVEIQANGGANCIWTPSSGLTATSGSLVTAEPLVDTWYYVTITDSAECSPVYTDSVFVEVADPIFQTVEHDMSGVYYGDGVEDRAQVQESVIPDNSDFTVEMLFKSCDLSNNPRLFDSRGSTAGTGIEFGILASGTRLSVVMEGAGNLETAEVIFLDTNLSENYWHHVAVTHSVSDSMNTVFFDGLEIASFTNGIIPFPKVVIGGKDHNFSNSFQGQIDDVRISDIVRYSGSIEISSLSIANDANTVALWNFEDGQNSTDMADVSGGYDLYGQGGAHVNAPLGSSQYAEFFGIPVQIEAYGGSICSWTPTSGLDDPTVFNPLASPIESGYYNVTVTDSNACYIYQDSVYIEVDLTTVDIASEGSETVRVFPNPNSVSSAIQIAGLEPGMTYIAQLFDVNGRLIGTQRISDNSSFDISSMDTGTYILNVNKVGNDSTAKGYTVKLILK